MSSEEQRNFFFTTEFALDQYLAAREMVSKLKNKSVTWKENWKAFILMEYFIGGNFSITLGQLYDQSEILVLNNK